MSKAQEFLNFLIKQFKFFRKKKKKKKKKPIISSLLMHFSSSEMELQKEF